VRGAARLDAGPGEVEAPGAPERRGVEHEARIGRPRHLEAVAEQPEPVTSVAPAIR
jgi:hypothetical protein